jgi:hypothetical protein
VATLPSVVRVPVRTSNGELSLSSKDYTAGAKCLGNHLERWFALTKKERSSIALSLAEDVLWLHRNGFILDGFGPDDIWLWHDEVGLPLAFVDKPVRPVQTSQDSGEDRRALGQVLVYILNDGWNRLWHSYDRTGQKQLKILKRCHGSHIGGVQAVTIEQLWIGNGSIQEFIYEMLFLQQGRTS